MISRTFNALQASGQILQASACSTFLRPFVSCTSGLSCSAQQHERIHNTLEEVRVAMMESVAGTGKELVPSLPESHTKEICGFYNGLDFPGRCEFLSVLAKDFNVDHEVILKASENLHMAHEKGEGALLQAESRLRQVLQPQYGKLFAQIGRIQSGMKFLVDMRKDMLDILSSQSQHDNPHLKAMNSTLREMLSHWFSAGLMNLLRITWYSSCDILQKISEYEAVHPVRNWADLKRRVGPYRRCFVYTHNSMPREPVMVLHTALTEEISNSIQSIVRSRSVDESEVVNSMDGPVEDPEKTSTAIFYSISSSQKGLQGVDLGNYLIKQVVKELIKEFPKMHQFSSLSPIPGFREWLLGEIHKELKDDHSKSKLFTNTELKSVTEIYQRSDRQPLDVLRKLLLTNDWMQSTNMVSLLEGPLMRLCARYLYLEKRRGYALNPVANFHLRNGAVMWRINWQGDISPRGVTSSCGIMVNYRYFLENTDFNSRRYVEDHHIEASPQVLDLITQFKMSTASPPTSNL
ncbi:malonyl-CoA decarboxylase, mitochondrial-like [Ptychodera flava]|uniref:malonyl-CoA decarboxylase, mitochondrial-like n=1 Tax=Ptychodera flava TaxID=63121 RepID=UPI00396A0E4D